MASFVSSLGWLLMGVSLVALWFSFGAVVKLQGPPQSAQQAVPVLILIMSPGGILSGLMVVCVGQLIRACVDTADNTGAMRAMLAVARGDSGA